MIVKPRFGFGSANTWAVHSSKQLEVLFNYAPDMVAQEFVAGDELNLSILAGLDGQVLSIVPCLKVLMACGETQQAVTVDAPQLLELGRRLAITTGLMGPMDVDLIRARDGTAYVIDVNPRFGGTYPLSHMAGADFPRLIVQIMEGARPSPRIGVYDRGICMLKSVGVVGGTLENGLPALSMGARL
jgi:carbamoyl-phosphate synthase large subunit